MIYLFESVCPLSALCTASHLLIDCQIWLAMCMGLFNPLPAIYSKYYYKSMTAS